VVVALRHALTRVTAERASAPDAVRRWWPAQLPRHSRAPRRRAVGAPQPQPLRLL